MFLKTASLNEGFNITPHLRRELSSADSLRSGANGHGSSSVQNIGQPSL
jgi:hypothetical protein